MKRKEFIKSSCLACMGVLTAGVAINSLTSCVSFPVVKLASKDQKLFVDLISLNQNKMNIIRPSDLDYDVFVHELENGEFIALILKCTHQDWNLAANPKGFNCSLHGSAFDINGKVVQGPATKSLKRLNYFKDNNQLIISLI